MLAPGNPNNCIERLEPREVRNFEVDHAGARWHLDFHHRSSQGFTRDGTQRPPVLLEVLDDRSRIACHLEWCQEETTRTLFHGLSQAGMKRGLTLDMLNKHTRTPMCSCPNPSATAAPGHPQQ